MTQRSSKWAGVLLAMSLVLGLPFVVEAAGQFTVEFNADGTISRVFQGGITSPPGEVVHPRPESEGFMANHLAGKSVSKITSVTIATTADDPCISSGGRDWCW